ncbi:DUF3034 family protein [Sphingomonas abietis]|uniref:DUF3034 family protein n=1 Tax=Sphingomonas abietis TaxID=3012344 RepID=A0ABY7NLZ6_9SPHN|nr:DUF3034 family protein [Sphingomonas abietis]WBO21496.1 DUF3034 family protein [Sphingomonas abietis]
MGSALFAGPAQAGSEMRAGGKLVLTNGVSSVEGAAGGGLATWALIGGNDTTDGIGGSAHVTYVPLSDYSLTSYGAAVSAFDRIELSYTRQVFDTHKIGPALGLAKGFTFDQDVFGAKVKLFGDAVYGQDTILPQVSVGVQYKHANRGAVIHAVGGAHDSGTDFFVSATKILMGQSLILDGTMRATKANQFGLLGFGGDRHDHYSAQFEGSAALMLTRKFAAGVEVRTKPDNLGFAKEDAAWDGFVAYAMTKNVSLTAAYVDLGSIATVNNQRGAFLSLQTSF